MRKKAWARPELAQCPYFLEEPTQWKGRWQQRFPKAQPLHLELGCGKCTFTAELAAQHPQINYIAIDQSCDVLGVARRNIEARYQAGHLPVDNILLVAYNIEQIPQLLDGKDQVEKLYINFCNPWPKARHHKKRLTHPRQLALYRDFMRHGAELHFKTDDESLYLATLRYLREGGLELLWHSEDLHSCADTPQCRITSEHEDRFAAQGIPIKAIVARFP